MTILLVDNNRFFTSVIQTMLTKAGFNSLICAENGLDYSSHVDGDGSPDVVIIDETQCYLQEVDILETIRQSRPETKIIILTGADSEMNVDVLPDYDSIYFMDKGSITADNLPQLLYNIFTEKISSKKPAQINKVFTSLRRSFTGMLNFGIL